MGKMDSTLRSLLEKIAKTFHDMSLEGSNNKLTINGQSLRQFLEDFHWDETRFPERATLGEHKNLIQRDMKHYENEMKKMIQKYQDVHSNVIAMKRKRGWGSTECLTRSTNILTTPLSLLLKEEEVLCLEEVR